MSQNDPSINGVQATPPDFDPAQFRLALSGFATGVTIVTARAGNGQTMQTGGNPHPFVGVTVSSFNSVSLEPPLVLWSLGTRSTSLPVFRDASHYVISVLAGDQVELCRRFAYGSGDRFAGTGYQLSRHGIPIIDGALAWFECFNRRRHTEGDHLLFIGEVERCGFAGNHLAPLVFHVGRFSTTRPHNDDAQD